MLSKLNLPNQLGFDVQSAANKTKKLLEEASSLQKTNLVGDRFNQELFEAKVENDASFFIKMMNNLEESTKVETIGKLQPLFENVKDILQEVNLKPRSCSAAVDNQELNESTITDIYSKYLTENITKQYSQPLFEGTLLADNADHSKLLMESLIKTGASDKVNVEHFTKYALFENTLFENMSSMIIPSSLRKEIDTFISIQESSYFEMFDRNAKVLLEENDAIMSDIIGNLAVMLFEESTKINCASFKGISKVLRD
jgi:hypothetical protein